jgi:acetyl-CoA C-acetyltransferase
VVDHASAAGFRYECPQDAVDALPRRTPASDYEGDATVETYTVVHDRDGEPELAILALLTEDGRRAWGNTADRDDMVGLMENEGCGRKARLNADGRAELR